MKVNIVYGRKLCPAQYESTQYMCTIEAESDYRDAADMAAELFEKAKCSVERQIALEQNMQPERSASSHEADRRGDGDNGNNNHRGSGNGSNGNGHGITESQERLLQKLLREGFSDRAEARRWLQEQTGMDRTMSLSRKDASRLIERLMDRSRGVAV